MTTNFPLNSNDSSTTLIKKSGITTWNSLLKTIQSFPYGRNSNRTDLNLVFSERKGSCSSKHAFLKKIADLNNIPNIQLILGMYKMTEKNTPKIGTILTDNNIAFIPEAHCYLKIGDIRTDITTQNSDFTELKKDILKEIEITPEQVSTYKVQYHKKYLKNWLTETNIKYSFDELWNIREQCIVNLSN